MKRKIKWINTVGLELAKTAVLVIAFIQLVNFTFETTFNNGHNVSQSTVTTVVLLGMAVLVLDRRPQHDEDDGDDEEEEEAPPVPAPSTRAKWRDLVPMN